MDGGNGRCENEDTNNKPRNLNRNIPPRASVARMRIGELLPQRGALAPCLD